MRWARILQVILVLVVVGGLGGWLLLFRPVSQPGSNDMAAVFNHGSIGNEETQGIPYWIWRVLPQVFPDLLPNGGDGYAAFGLQWQRGDELPIGFSRMTLGVVPRVAPNCAFCHQGSYRLSPQMPAQLVSAGAGTRVDVQAYLRFLIAAGQDPRFTPDRLMDEIEGVVALPLWQRGLYRYVLIPATRQALRQQALRFAWTETRPDWGPGRIDPFNPVKFSNLGLPDDDTIGNSDMMPLWALGPVATTDSVIRSMHWDGLMTDLHETVVAGAIGDGMTQLSYPRSRKNLARMEDFIRVQVPPASPFRSDLPPGDPYRVEAEAVQAGHALYRRLCADCHDPAGARFRQPIPVIELGTDRHRLDMWSVEARDRYAAYEPDYNWGFRSFRKTQGYVAVNLTGLWLRGPYLHNGSVPSLRALLLPPQQRPVTFTRGNDLIDPANGGFRADPGGPGWLYDTRQPGNGNGGHLWGTELSPGDRESLLSYLKTL
ncbi:cytochrome c [Paracoccus limosus]|uniref:Cytochrome c n=1 Tax=Paracoccus limosus TaxID=913252 RepID=A0A844H0V5_9RHOB|nr:cytochrome c [Paracoccus limosus]MTH33184.1 cytochrome c [Paracoccus limosus]